MDRAPRMHTLARTEKRNGATATARLRLHPGRDAPPLVGRLPNGGREPTNGRGGRNAEAAGESCRVHVQAQGSGAGAGNARIENVGKISVMHGF